jgi:hypothetical protein
VGRPRTSSTGPGAPAPGNAAAIQLGDAQSALRPCVPRRRHEHGGHDGITCYRGIGHIGWARRAVRSYVMMLTGCSWRQELVAVRSRCCTAVLYRCGPFASWMPVPSRCCRVPAS